jgi:hypothetical protein
LDITKFGALNVRFDVSLPAVALDSVCPREIAKGTLCFAVFVSILTSKPA